MNFEQIKQEISISAYLESIGYKPQFENKYSARYISPYRTDTNPSLSVNLSTNLFFDHGTGKGGNVIQLVALVNNCSDYEASKILTEQRDSFSFHCKPIKAHSTGITINKIKTLENIALLQYLESRCIDVSIAKMYCQECYYSVASGNYFAIAFESDSKGVYELRSKFFKGCVGAKDITTVKNNSDTLLIFEGFMDMLSFATFYGNDAMLSFDTIVLNSIANIQKIKNSLLAYKKVHLYLDNDDAGQNLVSQLLSEHSNILDCSNLYKNYKDFNDHLISKNEQ